MSASVEAKAGAVRVGEEPGEPLDLDHLLASLEEPIRTRPTRRMTQGELEKYLEKAADMLRGNVDHSEFRGYVFALLFYKRISDRYDEEVRELTTRLGDEALARDPKMHNFVVPEEARWDAVVRTPKTQLGQALNDAMLAVEKANAPKFDGILTNKIDFNKQDELPRDKLVNLINHFSSQAMDRAQVPDDLFGNSYEYLIRNFASRAGKSSGEFYTPAEVGFLMSEMIEPDEGHHVCDWASGSGGLLLQCIRYLTEHGKDPNKLFLHAQESNVATYNISRINMILHGIHSWDHQQGDSLRHPHHLDERKRLKQFDRIIMNPPFSLEDWGYDDVQGGDPYQRLGYGMPPAKNGDYAWLQHVVKSLRDYDPETQQAGKGMIVMSQGVLFRGQPEQTMEEDGTNQKADAEYNIRRGFIEDDLIECIVVLPSKLFYGNGVPACLLLLNKNKPAERKDKVLMIWASRHFQKSSPQNLLRASDLMRILVPWRAYGDLEKACALVDDHKAFLIRDVEEDRDQRLRDIEDAYGPVIGPLNELRSELEKLEAANIKVAEVWAAIDKKHPYFAPLSLFKELIENLEARIKALARGEKKAAQDKLKAIKAGYNKERKAILDAIRARRKKVAKAVKDLDKLQVERDTTEAELTAAAQREIEHLDEAATDLMRICSDTEESQRSFTLVERKEIEENEFNLNLPRYVDTFEPEEELRLNVTIEELNVAEEARSRLFTELKKVLEHLDGTP